MTEQTKPRSIKVNMEDDPVQAASKAGTAVAIVAFAIIAALLLGIIYWLTR